MTFRLRSPPTSLTIIAAWLQVFFGCLFPSALPRCRSSRSRARYTASLPPAPSEAALHPPAEPCFASPSARLAPSLFPTPLSLRLPQPPLPTGESSESLPPLSSPTPATKLPPSH